MPDHSRRNHALLALTAAALGLPGIGRGQTASQADDGVRLDYHYSVYREDDLQAAQNISAVAERRYEIDSHQFRVLMPAGEDTELQLNFALESMSGASPWYVVPGPAGRPVQVMSGATIQDRRTDVSLQATRRFDANSASLRAGYSGENDYRAINAAVEGQHETPDRLNTFSGGVGFSSDTLDPTDGGSARFPTRIRHAEREALTAFAGYARVLNADSVVQTSVSYAEHMGFLSDPYKQAFIVDTGPVPDSRPDRRSQWTWLTRLRRFFSRTDGALHADYRYYRDDWDLRAHTLELAWHQNLVAGWRLVPSVRGYSQTASYFYAPFSLTAYPDGLASSDYRQSPYGAYSYALGVNGEVAGWGLALRYQVYDSDANYALQNVETENPGLVDFDVLSLSLKKIF